MILSLPKNSIEIGFDVKNVSDLSFVAYINRDTPSSIALTEGLWKSVFGENMPPQVDVMVNGFRIDCIHGDYTERAFLNRLD